MSDLDVYALRCRDALNHLTLAVERSRLSPGDRGELGKRFQDVTRAIEETERWVHGRRPADVTTETESAKFLRGG